MSRFHGLAFACCLVLVSTGAEARCLTPVRAPVRPPVPVRAMGLAPIVPVLASLCQAASSPTLHRSYIFWPRIRQVQRRFLNLLVEVVVRNVRAPALRRARRDAGSAAAARPVRTLADGMGWHRGGQAKTWPM